MSFSRLTAIALVLVVAACRSGPFNDIDDMRIPGLSNPSRSASPPATSANTTPMARPDSADSKIENPERLIGMDEKATLAELGQPDAVDQEAQAHLWHYRYPPACELILFFYVDMSTRSRHVLAYENRPASDTPEGAACASETTARRE